MNNPTQTTFNLARLGVLGLSSALLFTACGGGSGTSGTSTTATTPTSAVSDGTVGTISGFGSVIINGVRYDDSGATVKDDFGGSVSGSRLGLGMTVHLRGTNNDDGTGTASGISLFSELQGPISSLNVTANTFSILGFNVVVDSKTVFSDVSGLSALADGKIVEVYGLRNGSTVTASRIELKTPAAGDAVVKLRGPLSGLNATASTFTLGTLTVSYGSATVTPSASTLTDGTFVLVSSTSVPTGNALTASKVIALGKRPFSFDDGAKSELEGVIGTYTSISDFTVGSINVNATNAVFVRGTASGLASGARVEIKGAYVNNVLVARLVKFDNSSGTDEFELHGAVSNFASLSSFVVRGVTVDASGSGVLFERGVAADVANGRQIEVEGAMQTGSSGSILKATKVKFEDVSSSSTSGSSSSSSSSSSSNSGEFEFRGKVASVSGNTLVVGTRTVTLSSTTVFRRISQTQVVSGILLEIKGTLLADGSVRAERISLED